MGSSWKAAFGIFLVFALGCVSGALSTSVYFHQNPEALIQHDPSAAADTIETRLTRHLSLEANQREQIHQILMDYLQQRKMVQSRIQPDIRTLNVQMIRQIRDALHPDQQAGFRDNVVDFRRRLAGAAAPGNRPAPPPAATIGATNTPPGDAF